MKEENLFHIRGRKRLGVCIECYEKNYGSFKETEEKRKQKQKNQYKSRVEKTRNYVKLVLQSNKCVDCENNDWEVLEFDHKIPEEKAGDVSFLISTGNLYALMEEIEKCEIVCANCHRKRTIKQFGHWRGQ